MWTDTTRQQHRRDKLKYASDLTEAEWLVLVGELPPAKRRGYPRCTDLGQVVEAIFDILEAECQWWMLPDSFPMRSRVQRYFYAWQNGWDMGTHDHRLHPD